MLDKHFSTSYSRSHALSRVRNQRPSIPSLQAKPYQSAIGAAQSIASSYSAQTRLKRIAVVAPFMCSSCSLAVNKKDEDDDEEVSAMARSGK